MNIKTIGGFGLCLGLLFAFEVSMAEPLVSTNFGITWGTTDAVGGTRSSANFVVLDSIGQSPVPGQRVSSNFVLHDGFQAAPDTDADRVRDFMDNCTLDPNSNQLDTNQDGFGNICDADLDNDLVINFIDLGILKAAMFSTPSDTNWNPHADLNGDNAVNFIDLGLMKFFFFGEPGPSGIAP